jgi:D-alanine-D-alanine ligase
MAASGAAMSNKFKGKRIGVIMGGPSSERDVSLNSGKGIFAALQSKGYDTVAIDWRGGDDDLGVHLRREKIDVAWIALHGTYGEDGCVQGLLECYGIPYTGSGVLASAIAMDKVATRRVFDQESIESPRWRRHHGAADVARIGFPLVVKPSSEGSSVGVAIVKTQATLQAALDEAKKHRGVVLLEEYVKGREINVGVLDDEALGEVEIRPATEFYDYEAKYLRNDTQYLSPAPISDDERRMLHDLAVRAHKALGCSGATRVDLILVDGGRAVCLEINTLPGMTDHSLLPKIAAQRNIDYATLVERILDSATLHA